MANPIEKSLLEKIAHQIQCDLTVLREDNFLLPFDGLEVALYLSEHEEGIAKALEEMKATWSPEEMANPENDWIREVLYKYVESHLTEGMEDDE
jgi:hypothetical protein